jgi:hypothetical protein
MILRTTILIPAFVATAAVAAFGLTGCTQAADQGTQRVDQVSRALTELGLQGTGAAPNVAAGRLAVGGVDVVLPAGASPVTQGPTSIVDSALPDTQLVAQGTPDGATRIMSVATSSGAPTRVTYDFPGAVLKPNADGSVVVTRGGQPVAAIDAPWAIDASGRSVPTRYEISGSQLTQVTDHHGAAYPVVSDPSVSLCLWGILPAVCIKYNRAETLAISTRLVEGVAAVAAAMCNKLPSRYRTACRILIGWKFSDLVDKVNQAKATGRCLLMKFPFPILPGYVTYYVVNC